MPENGTTRGMDDLWAAVDDLRKEIAALRQEQTGRIDRARTSQLPTLLAVVAVMITIGGIVVQDIKGDQLLADARMIRHTDDYKDAKSKLAGVAHNAVSAVDRARENQRLFEEYQKSVEKRIRSLEYRVTRSSSEEP